MKDKNLPIFGQCPTQIQIVQGIFLLEFGHFQRGRGGGGDNNILGLVWLGGGVQGHFNKVQIQTYFFLGCLP